MRWVSSSERRQAALRHVHGGQMVVQLAHENCQGLTVPAAPPPLDAPLTCSPPRGAGGGDPVKERLEKWLGTAETLGFKLSEDQVDALRCLATTTAPPPRGGPIIIFCKKGCAAGRATIGKGDFSRSLPAQPTVAARRSRRPCLVSGKHAQQRPRGTITCTAETSCFNVYANERSSGRH